MRRWAWGRERERGTDESRRPFEGAREVVELVALGAVADAELDAEIDTDADEEHGEIDRDQVEGADHHQAERRSHGEADEEVDEDGDDQARGAECTPQDE